MDEALDDVDEERRRQSAGHEVPGDDRDGREEEPVPDLWQQQVGEQHAEDEGDGQRHSDLGRDQQLQRERHAEPPGQTDAAQLRAGVAHERERDERHEEDADQVQVAAVRVPEHVAREAEQVAADERRPRRARDVAAEEECGPRGDGRE